jgi:hypothetical protein
LAERPDGSFAGHTEPNPKEKMNAMMNRSRNGGETEKSPVDEEDPIDAEVERETSGRAQQRLAPASTAPNNESPAEKVSEKKKFDEK